MTPELLKKKSGKFQIYALSDPATDELRYIGMTEYLLQERLKQHCFPSHLKKAKDYRSQWITSLIQRGLKPKIELVEEVDTYEKMLAAEEFWITQFRALGFCLANYAPGGKASPNRGRPMSPETKMKLSIAKTGQKQDPAVAARIAAMRIGTKLSPETKARISASHMGKPKPRSREMQLKMATYLGARPFTDQNGVVYQFIRDAATAHGIHYNTVMRELHGRSKRRTRFHYVNPAKAANE